MRDVNWGQVLVFGLVVLIVFSLGIGVLLLLFGGGGGMMGGRMMGPRGMRGGWCPWCGGGGGGGVRSILAAALGLTVTCLLPLGVLALLVVGGVWLARRTGQGGSSVAVSEDARPVESGPSQVCPNCERPVEPDWNTCPNCGEDLRGG